MKTHPPPPPPPVADADADADTLTAPPDEPSRKRRPWSKPTISTIYGEITSGPVGHPSKENATYRPTS